MSGTAAHPARLSFTGVTRAFGRELALDDVSFALAAGQSTALLGLNGAGKSTLLRLALDLLAPDRGTITLGGRPARDPRARTGVAYLPERFQAPHYLTGEELLTVLLDQHGVTYAHAAAVRECAALGLDPAVLARRARHYSKGMTQKLGLIACLLSGSDLLVLDEPMSGLDPLAHGLCRARLQQARAAGTTLLFSSHALHDVGDLCERVLVLQGGRLVFDDTLAALSAQAPEGTLEQAFLRVLGISSQ